MADFTIKQGDTRPTLLVGLYDPDGDPVVLTGANVLFSMGVEPGAPILQAPAVVVDAVNGIVEYQWAAGDTETAGLFQGEFQVTFGNGTIVTYPNDINLQVLVKGQVGT